MVVRKAVNKISGHVQRVNRVVHDFIEAHGPGKVMVESQLQAERAARSVKVVMCQCVRVFL
jgi:hypothetical protein